MGLPFFMPREELYLYFVGNKNKGMPEHTTFLIHPS